MTISNTTVIQIFSGNGSTTDFAIPFDFQNDSEILVYTRAADGTEALKTITTHYTLDNPATTVTMLTAPASGTKLVIKRATAQTQTADYITNGSFPAATHEAVLDKVVQQVQELQHEVTKAARFGITSAYSGFRIPEPVANSVLIFNAAADDFEIGPTTTEIINAEGYAGDASDFADAAAASAAAALASQTAAETAETNAETAETNAETAETNAEAAQAAAEAAQAAAEAAQAAAETAETNAETAETNAETAETNAETAETNAEAAQVAAEAAQAAAEASALAADASADAAAISETNAAASAAVFTSLNSGQIRVGNASNVSTAVTPTGDVTISNTGVTAIGANKVTNAMLDTVATQTFKGRTTAATGNVEDLTAAQATAILDAFVGDSGAGGTKGLVPAPAAGDTAAEKFLKADGAWTALASAAPTVFGSRGTPRSVVAATGITTGASHMSASVAVQDIYVEGSTSGENICATFSAGTVDGQRMTIVGRNDSKPLTVDSTTTNVKTVNGPMVLGEDNSGTFRWDTSVWCEIFRSN